MLLCVYTAISVKVVPKKREKVEYERERLINRERLVLFLNTLPFIGVPLSLKLDPDFL